MGKAKKKKGKKTKKPEKQPEKSMDVITNEELNALLIPGNSMMEEDYGMGNLIYII